MNQDDIIKNEAVLKEKLKTVSPPIQDFYRRISGRAIKTKLSYYTNLNLFFRFLSSTFDDYKDVNLSNVTYDVLNSINIDHIDRYKEYLSNYEYQKIFKDNSEELKSEIYKSVSKNYLSITRRNKIESINAKLATIKSLYSNLYEIALSKTNDDKNKLTQNIAGLIKLEKIHVKIKNILQTDEFIEFLKVVENGKGDFGSLDKKYIDDYSTRDVCIVSLLGETGIRISELCGIDLMDIDLKEKKILINRKGGKQEYIYFKFSTKYLKKYYLHRKQDKRFTENALFISSKLTRITPRGVQLMINKYARLTTDKKISPHTFRRSFATNLYEMTGDIFLVSSLIGDTVGITTKHYAFQSDSRKRDAIDGYLKEKK